MMAPSVFDRETLLDLLVNVIPLGILIFFIALFVFDNPFGGNPIYTYLQFGIVVVTFGLLLVLTYFSARAVATDEQRTEGTIWEELPPGGVPTGAEEELPTGEEEASDEELPAGDEDADEAADAEDGEDAEDAEETADDEGDGDADAADDETDA